MNEAHGVKSETEKDKTASRLRLGRNPVCLGARLLQQHRTDCPDQRNGLARVEEEEEMEEERFPQVKLMFSILPPSLQSPLPYFFILHAAVFRKPQGFLLFPLTFTDIVAPSKFKLASASIQCILAEESPDSCGAGTPQLWAPWQKKGALLPRRKRKAKAKFFIALYSEPVASWPQGCQHGACTTWPNSLI